MAQESNREADNRGRNTRVLLVLLILVLLLLLCGLLYVLRSVSTSAERTPILAEPDGVELVWQAFGSDVLGPMKRPFDVAYDGEDTLYVTVPDEGRILAFDSDGGNGRVFVEDRRGEGDQRSLQEFQVLAPAGIDVAEDGTIYIADRDKMAILVFSPTGQKLRELLVMAPKAVEATGGRLYVLSETSTLFVFDLEGNQLGQWGTQGRLPDQLDDPMAVAVDNDGTIYIADLNNNRILALSPELEVLWQYGEAATTQEEQKERILSGPAGITLAGDGSLYVVDGLGSNIVILDKQGKPLSTPLGELGLSDDQFYYPTGIDWISDNTFVLCDSMHNRVIGIRLTAQVTE